METKEVFDKVASKYDIMNDIMSLGAHRYWKELLIDWLSPESEMHIIDVAGGTGDVARRFLKRVKGKGKATVCDPNEFMVEEGKKIIPLKIKLNGLLHLQKISLLKKIHLMHTSYPLVLGIFLILKNHWVKHIEC